MLFFARTIRWGNGLRAGGDAAAVAVALLWFSTSSALGQAAGAGQEQLTEAQQEKLFAEWDAFRREALDRDREGKWREAAAAGQKMIALQQRLMGEVEVSAQWWDWIAERQERGEDFPGAEQSRGEALRIRGKLLGADHWKVGDAKLALARTKRLAALPAEQRPKVRLAEQKNREAVRLFGEGKYEAALALAREALEVRQSVLGEGDLSCAESLNNLALIHKSLGEYAKAEPLYRQAVAIHERTLGAAHPATATSLNNLAGLYEALGDYAKTEPLYLQALEARKKTLGESHPDYATSLNNLGTLHSIRGDYVKAEPLFRQAMEITKKAVGTEHADYATSLNNLGILYKSLGDFAKAEPLFREALAIKQKTLGEAHPGYATGLNNLAGVYELMGDFARAEQPYRQALEIRRRVLGESHPDMAVSLNNLGGVYFSLREFAKAEPLYRQALEIRRRALGERHPEFAQSLNNLATLRRAMGNYAEAEGLLMQALEIRKSSVGEGHPDYASGLSNLGVLYWSKGDSARARVLYEKALEISLRNLELAAAGQSERQQLAMAESVRYQLHNYLILAGRSPQDQEEAYERLLAWKGQVLARQQAIRAVRDNPALEAIYGQLEVVAAELGRKAFATPPAAKQAAWKAEVEAMSDKKERLEQELAEKSLAFRRALRRVGLGALREALPADAVLIDILESAADVTEGKDPQAKRIVEPRFVAFVVRKAGPVEMVVLGRPAEVERRIEAWRESLGRTAESREAAAWLGQHVWRPLEERLGSARIVLISPDGALGKLPFAALPGKEAGSYLVEEERLIAVIPSAAALPAWMAEEEARGDLKNMFALGGVDYEGAASGGTAAKAARPPRAFGRSGEVGGEMRFEFLPATEGELAGIERKYRQNFGPEGITTLEKGAASESAVRQMAQSHKYLHLATHGFFAAPQFKSALTRSLGDGARFGQEKLLSKQSIAGFHPNLLSGVVLAGANRPGEVGDDGILTAEEVQTLDLRGAQLVVLSACETGLGQTAGGEGLLGLQRAFQVAGAKTVIASLWKVDDVATRDLMDRFYDNMWNRNMGKLQALREAQRWMLKERGARGLVSAKEPGAGGQEPDGSKRLAPYFWAAFVLSGDWR